MSKFADRVREDIRGMRIAYRAHDVDFQTGYETGADDAAELAYNAISVLELEIASLEERIKQLEGTIQTLKGGDRE